MRRFVSFLSLFVFAISIVAGTTGSIYGTVSDENKNLIKGAVVKIEGYNQDVESNKKGEYLIIGLSPGSYTLNCQYPGFMPNIISNIEVNVDKTTDLNISMKKQLDLDDAEIEIYKEIPTESIKNTIGNPHNTGASDFNGFTKENEFKKVMKTPLSIFSIDVDAASYSNMRRFINNNQIPHKDAIRIEEMINYFNYNYEYPLGEVPFAINTEISDCPWNKQNKLVHIGLQGRKIQNGSNVKSNFVFLLDISSSMNSVNELGLFKKSFGLLLDALKPSDRVAIVVYSGSEGLVLPPTEAKDKKVILDTLNNLTTSASTTGSEGIALAHKIAEEYFIENGNNRIVLATNGDFVVGSTRTSELVEIIEKKVSKGIFLTILDFGNGHNNYSGIESIANKCNGNYFYIDNILEANKVLVTELAGTMFAIAKDVKLQIEFNPVKVDSYRLIGYENRLMDKKDFTDNNNDACGLGAGQAVTALYEIIPALPEIEKKIDDLKYQTFDTVKPFANDTDELMFVKLNYKEPNEDKSKLIEHPLIDDGEYFDKTSNNFRFSAAVAEFGMLLKESKFVGDSTFDSVIELAKGSMGKDEFGYRAEFVRLAEKAKLLKR